MARPLLPIRPETHLFRRSSVMPWKAPMNAAIPFVPDFSPGLVKPQPFVIPVRYVASGEVVHATSTSISSTKSACARTAARPGPLHRSEAFPLAGGQPERGRPRPGEEFRASSATDELAPAVSKSSGAGSVPPALPALPQLKAVLRGRPADPGYVNSIAAAESVRLESPRSAAGRRLRHNAAGRTHSVHAYGARGGAAASASVHRTSDEFSAAGRVPVETGGLRLRPARRESTGRSAAAGQLALEPSRIACAWTISCNLSRSERTRAQSYFLPGGTHVDEERNPATAVASLFASGAAFAAGQVGEARDTVKCEGIKLRAAGCKSANNACKGQNGCKGQGVTDASADECKAKAARSRSRKSSGAGARVGFARRAWTRHQARPKHWALPPSRRP
jgi:hypothetical protein